MWWALPFETTAKKNECRQRRRHEILTGECRGPLVRRGDLGIELDSLLLLLALSVLVHLLGNPVFEVLAGQRIQHIADVL